MRPFLRRVVLLLSLTLLVAAPALAAPAWKALGPYGGAIRTITVASSRVIYVTTQYEGAFRSTDGGASWVPIHGAFVDSNVAADPARPGTIYLATPAQKVVKSTDFGSHWTLANRGLEGSGVSAVAVDPARPSRVYAALDSRVFRSTNGGASWRPSRQAFPPSLDPKITELLAVPRPRGTVFAVASGKLWKSGDAGDTWKALDRGLPGRVTALAVSPSAPWTLYSSVELPEGGGGVLRSRDSGASWEEVRRPPGRVISLAVSPRSPRTVWAGTEDKGLLVSYDGGAHWQAAGPRGISKVTAVAVPASSPRTVFAATVPQAMDPGGVFASEDGGATWTRRNRGLAGLATFAMAADPAAPGVLWAARGSQGLLRSANGGRGWTLLPLPADGVAIAPSAPSILYAISPPRVWRSDDGGASWAEAAGAGGPIGPGGRLWVDPLSPDTLWSTGDGLRKSIDGGDTWVRQPLPGPGWVDELAFAPASPATIYAVGERPTTSSPSQPLTTLITAWRSTDGGATWTSIEQGLYGLQATALAIDPVDSRLVYLASCGPYCSPIGGIWKSTNGGSLWAFTGEDGLDSLEITALAASPIAGVVWAAGREGRIFRSADSGETWREAAGPQAHVIYQLSLDPQDPRRVYAATSSGVWVLEDKP